MARYKDLTGQKFNAWTVLQRDKNGWMCKCQCGNIRTVGVNALIEGRSKSCGCSSYFNLIGKKIGRLTVIKYVGHKHNNAYVLCKCDCGNKKVIKASDLKKKHQPVQSCGCLSQERIEYVKNHGMINLEGKKFGKWTVIKYKGNSKWLCKCECGNEKLVQTATLTNGDSTSCGKCYENKVDSNFFNNINTSEKAYILGLLYADGYNNEKHKIMRLDLQEEDLDILIKIKNIMKFQGEIKHYQNKNKIFAITGSNKEYKCKPTARLLIHNTNISEQLALKGCTNNKTYNITFPNKNILSIELYKDFIRGLIDGDGSISCWVDNKKTGHKKFSMTLTGTTELINSVKDIIISKVDCNPDIRSRYKERDNNNVTMAICGNRVIEKILDWLYKDSTIYLNRKFDKYIELKNINKKTTYNQNNLYCMKPIVQLNINKQIINEFKSIAETRKLGFNSTGVCQACKKDNHIYKNYLWFYKYDYELLLEKGNVING